LLDWHWFGAMELLGVASGRILMALSLSTHRCEVKTMLAGWRYRLLSLAAVAAGCVLLPVETPAWPQDSQGQQSSVADAARRAKQKKNAGKTPKVIDDDNLSSNLKTGGPDRTNVGASAAATVNPGQAGNAEGAAQPETANGEQAAAKEAEPGGDDQGAAEQDPEIAKAKEQVAQTEKELDLLKRGFALDSEAYYSKPDYSTDKAGKAKLDGEQQQIADKQQELEGAKARLAALREEHKRRKAKPAAASSPSGEKEKPAAGGAEKPAAPSTEKPATPPQP
jgi:hypothetical protein